MTPIIDRNHQLLGERFDSTQGQLQQLSLDMHMDLLAAFQDPDTFNVDDFKRYSVAEILSYLTATHDYYRRVSFKKIRYSIEALAAEARELSEIQGVLLRFFDYFENDLSQHMQEEEETLYPYIKSLVAAKYNGRLNVDIKEKMALIEFLLEHDHDCEQLLDRLIDFLQLKLSDYQDTMSLRLLLHRLQFLSVDLKVHSRIEEEVLVPLSISLEEEVLADHQV